MTEKQLIAQIQKLREIKPREDWVVLTKSRLSEELAGKEKWYTFLFLGKSFQYKLALAPVVSVFIIIGLFGFAQKTVPGDFLFPVKKIAETAQVGFSPTVEKPKVHLKLANKRLEDLSKIAEANQVKNLGPAIEEFQANIADAAKGLVEMNVNVTSSDPMVLKEIVAETQKLEENKQKVEALGIVVGETEGLENALSYLEKQTAAILIEDLEARTLSEEDQNLLEEARQAFQTGNYAQALEKIWILSNK